MICANILKRSRNLKTVFYCKEFKTYIDYKTTCQNCSKRILKANTPIKKVSKNKKIVSKETYQKVYERDKGICQLKDKNCQFRIELHHIIYRSEDKSKIDEPNNCILLCNYHHRLVHSNKHYWQPLLLNKVRCKNE